MLALAMGGALRFVEVFENIRALYLTDFENYCSSSAVYVWWCTREHRCYSYIALSPTLPSYAVSMPPVNFPSNIFVEGGFKLRYARRWVLDSALVNTGFRRWGSPHPYLFYGVPKWFRGDDTVGQELSYHDNYNEALSPATASFLF